MSNHLQEVIDKIEESRSRSKSIPLVESVDDLLLAVSLFELDTIEEFVREIARRDGIELSEPKEE